MAAGTPTCPSQRTGNAVIGQPHPYVPRSHRRLPARRHRTRREGRYAGLNTWLALEKAARLVTVWLRFESPISGIPAHSCQRFARTTASVVNLSALQLGSGLGAVVGSIPTAGSALSPPIMT